MNIAVLRHRCLVGRAVATAWPEPGHITVGTRDPRSTLVSHRARRRSAGVRHLGHQYPRIGLRDRRRGGGRRARRQRHERRVTLDGLRLAGEQYLDGKVLVTIANPLDFRTARPRPPFVMDTDSLGEQVQRIVPASRRERPSTRSNADLMVRRTPPPRVDACRATTRTRRDVVTGLLKRLRQPPTSSTSVTHLHRPAAPEMLPPVWLRLWGALGKRRRPTSRSGGRELPVCLRTRSAARSQAHTTRNPRPDGA